MELNQEIKPLLLNCKQMQSKKKVKPINVNVDLNFIFAYLMNIITFRKKYIFRFFS